LSPEIIARYKNNVVLIDLRNSSEEPTLQVIGQLLNEDLDQGLAVRRISDVPRRTLLSRITDHYREVLGNKAPISFDAEFKHSAGEKIFYRGILLPFSDNGENINFIMGAIRWISEEEQTLSQKSPLPQKTPLPKLSIRQKKFFIEEKTPRPSLLRDDLEKCRQLVQGQNVTGSRSRQSLYLALGEILRFYETCCAKPEEYQEILTAEGLKSQKRAPFTPALKLCFGKDYDKTRLTEYAAALAFVQKNNPEGLSMPDFMDRFPGGIKGCVKAARRGHILPKKRPEKSMEEKQAFLDNMPSLASIDMTETLSKNLKSDDKICLMIARKTAQKIEIIKILEQDKKRLDSLLNQIVKAL